MPAWRRRRFRFAVFLVKMWLLKALYRRTFPVPVTLKRFFAPLWLFIFIATSSLDQIPRLRIAEAWDDAVRYFGARIMVMDFPSNRPALSIFPTSASAVATRSSTA